MRRIFIKIFFVCTIMLLTLKPIGAYGGGNLCILGNWKYNQTDGNWLFDVSIVSTGDTFEVRLTDWNPNIYRNFAFEKNRVISRIRYNASLNIFEGKHFRVEDGGYFDDVTLHIVSPVKLRYEAKTKTFINGQSLTRKEDSASWFTGQWSYHQTDGSWLFDVEVIGRANSFEIKLVRWNESVYRNSKFQAGRLVSKLIYHPGENRFSGRHFRVEDGEFFDDVFLSARGCNEICYEAKTKVFINGQCLRRKN